MTLVLLAAGLAVAVVLSSGGARQLAELPLRAGRLLVAAAALQLGLAFLAPDSYDLRLTVGILSLGLVALFLAANAALAGVPLIAAGLLVNAAVVFANGAMPVSTETAREIGISGGELALATDSLREPMTDETRLPALADTIPVALPLRPQVVSPGDVLVASGVALMIVTGARKRRGRHRVLVAASSGREIDLRAQSEGESRTMASARESTTRGSYS